MNIQKRKYAHNIGFIIYLSSLILMEQKNTKTIIPQ